MADAFLPMTGPTAKTSSAVRTEIQPGVWLDSRLAAWFAAERLLVVADLHWGYAASHRARGNLVPAWGDEELEARLQSLLTEYQPAEMLWLGDVVHAAEGSGGAEKFLRNATCRITVLAGNHDRKWHRAVEKTAIRGRWFLHHGDVEREAPAGTVTIVGHHHPSIAWSDGAGGQVKLPALVATPTRLVMPAFSPWAAGSPCANLLTAGSQIWAIAPRRIFAIRSPDRAFASV